MNWDRVYDLAVAVAAVIGVGSCITTLLFILAAGIASRRTPTDIDEHHTR